MSNYRIECDALGSRELPLGATAVGTKLSIRDGYMEAAYPILSEIVGIDLQATEDLFDGLQNSDEYIDISSAIKALACGVSKIASDLRILSSGPNAGIGELTIPTVQPGSSIMPGKVNPVMPEMIKQICYQVCGNDTTIQMAVEDGELDLNVWEPIIIKAMAEAAGILTKGLFLFADKCIRGITVNKELCYKYCETSTALSTVIASLFDYPTGSRVAKRAVREGKTIKEVSIEEGLLSPAEAEEYLDPMLLTDGQLFSKKISEYKTCKED